MRVLTATFKPPLILRYTYELQAEPKFFWIVVSKGIIMAEPEHSTDYSPAHNIHILYATMFLCGNTALKNANSADFFVRFQTTLSQRRIATGFVEICKELDSDFTKITYRHYSLTL